MENKVEHYPQPTECGLYFGRTGNYGWYHLIIEVTGESPFLRIKSAYDTGLDGPRLLLNIDPDDVKWGPEVIVPDVGE
jgi:hypothetical protein